MKPEDKILDEAYRLLNESVKEPLMKGLSKPEGAIQTGNGFRVVDKQVRTITAIWKRFKWKRKSIFNFICSNTPGLEAQLQPADKKFYKLSALYSKMSKAEKSKIISMLDAIQKRNKENAANNR